MTRRRFSLYVLCALFALGGNASSARAQGAGTLAEPGFQPNRDYLTLLPFEAIDTGSNNIILTFTDLALSGNGGRELRFDRVFSNRVDEDPGGPQWRFGIGGVPMRVIERPYPTQPIEPEGSIASEQLTTPYFWMLDGSRLKTTYVTQPDPNETSTLDNVRTHNFWYYYRPSRTLFIPDGTIAVYDVDGRLIAIKDAFDNGGTNVVTLMWSPDSLELEVEQSLGNGQSRTVVVTLNDKALPESLTYNGQAWNYFYSAPGQLAEVVPPLGPGWTYDYSNEQFSSGKVTQVTTPLGGIVEYTYADMEFYAGGTPFVVNLLETRHLYDQSNLLGEWTFAYLTQSVEAIDQTTITLPSGTKLIYVYGAYSGPNVLAGAWQLRFRYVQSPDGSPIEEEERQYTDLLLAARSQEPWGVPRLFRRLITRADQTYTTEYTYTALYFDNFHRPKTITERGPSGTVERTKQLTYKHQVHPLTHAPQTGTAYVVGLPTSETTTVTGMTTVMEWTYDETTAFRKTENRYGITTEFAPDALGNVATVTKDNDKATSFTYEWGVLKNTSTPGVVVTRVIDPDGTVASETTAGRTTVYEEYDALSRLKRTQPPGSTNTVFVDYDNTTGRSTTVTRGTSSVTTITDGFGRPVRTEEKTDDIVRVRTRSAYDGEGRKKYQSYPFEGTFEGAMDIGTSFTYDRLGRLGAETHPDTATRTRQYDDATNSVTLRDEEDRETVLTYRAFGHPDDARLVSVVDANEQEWTYTYDAIGNLAQVVAPTGETRTWLRDTRGLLTSETHPESGTVQYTHYDDAGILKRKVDANGAEFVYAHDDNDRLIHIVTGPRATIISYEPGSDNRLWMSNGDVSTTFGYDTAGRLAQRQDEVGGYAFTSGYGYNQNDQLTTLTYPSGRIVGYDRDGAGRVTDVVEAAADRDYASDMTYHASGALATYTAGNNIFTTIGYDPDRYWVKTISADALQLTYSQYDAVGNVETIGDSRSGMGQSLTYDSLDRLETFADASLLIEYAYDAHGNRQTAWADTFTYEPGTLRGCDSHRDHAAIRTAFLSGASVS